MRTQALTKLLCITVLLTASTLQKDLGSFEDIVIDDIHKTEGGPEFKRHPLYSSFNTWKGTYQVEYMSDSEEETRFNNYIQSTDRVTHMENMQLGFTPTLGKFADKTIEEVKRLHTGLIQPSEEERKNFDTDISDLFIQDSLRQGPQPNEVDWVKDGHFSPVRNQGACGSCYSFSTISVVEAWYHKKTKTKIQISEQQVVDCSGSYGNLGCMGGYPSRVFLYLKLYGAMPRDSYTYNAMNFQRCRYTPLSKKLQIVKSFKSIQKNVAAMKAALLKSPLAAGINHAGLVNYKNGILRHDIGGRRCPDALTHAVTVVGYGEENGIKYWKIRNSWGQDWGINGYFKIEIDETPGSTGVCGIQADLFYLDE